MRTEAPDEHWHAADSRKRPREGQKNRPSLALKPEPPGWREKIREAAEEAARRGRPFFNFLIFLPFLFSPNLKSQEMLDEFNKNASVVVKTLEAVSKQQDEQYKLMQLKMQQASLQSYLTPRVQPVANQVFPACMRPIQTTTPPSCMVNDSQGLAMAQMIINASYQHQSTYAQNLSEDNQQTGLGCLPNS